MRKKLRRNIVAGIAFAILCAGLIFGLVLDVQKKSSQTQTEQVETQIQIEELSPRHPREGGDPGVVSQDSSSTSVSEKLNDEGLLVKIQSGVDIKTINNSQKATISIDGENFEVDFMEELTVYDAMNILKEENKIRFEGKKYPALGFFVTQINSLQSGNGKNLFYYVNDEEASVGISTYVLKEGDIIEWKLK